jgi:hypothetical protein
LNDVTGGNVHSQNINGGTGKPPRPLA